MEFNYNTILVLVNIHNGNYKGVRRLKKNKENKKKYVPESKRSIETKERIRTTLGELIKMSGLTQADIAAKCNWYRIDQDGDKVPNQAKVSGYVTGKKFSFPGLIDMLDMAFDMDLPQFFASASNEIPLTVEQSEINKIMMDLTPAHNDALVATAKSMRVQVIQVQKLKEQVKQLKS